MSLNQIIDDNSGLSAANWKNLKVNTVNLSGDINSSGDITSSGTITGQNIISQNLITAAQTITGQDIVSNNTLFIHGVASFLNTSTFNGLINAFNTVNANSGLTIGGSSDIIDTYKQEILSGSISGNFLMSPQSIDFVLNRIGNQALMRIPAFTIATTNQNPSGLIDFTAPLPVDYQPSNDMYFTIQVSNNTSVNRSVALVYDQSLNTFHLLNGFSSTNWIAGTDIISFGDQVISWII